MPAARWSGASATNGTVVVQLGDDTIPLRHVADVVGVHLGDHERDVGLHAERRRLVDDARAALDRLRRPLECKRVVDVDDDEVEAVEAAVGEHAGTRPRRP